MAYRYCYNALNGAGTQESSAAAARVNNGICDELFQDMVTYNKFFDAKRSETAESVTNAASAAYLRQDEESETDKTYSSVCDLLVSWHIQQVVLPSIAVEESPFDPLDESQVDLSGLVNARIPETTAPQEENNG
jgi:hypothetical protein